MDVNDFAKNGLIKEDSGVWTSADQKDFSYSDGLESENYLDYVFRHAKDLSSASSELETYIKDWPSKYHLTTKRAQLLSGFNFDSTDSVLEVGCGCGAITRYLGETFNDVTSIEGSLVRARLARLRTADLNGVTVINSRFQDVTFAGKFDLIVCVGVYEYSASFVKSDTPYEDVLAYFKDLLTPNGQVIIAIENQFGLKYFNSAKEDHVGESYVGLEGYYRRKENVKTFGRYELEEKLKKYFPFTSFYYPYPDYKLPDCVISDSFLASSRAGELVSEVKSSGYPGGLKGVWDEPLVLRELDKNRLLPFFSNAFLVFAGNRDVQCYSCFDQLAVKFSSERDRKFKTKTRFYLDEEKDVIVSKKLLSGKISNRKGKLQFVETLSKWNDIDSLQTELFRECVSNTASIPTMFKKAKVWLEYLESKAEQIDDGKILSGEYVDCIFSNVYIYSDKVSVIDEEWVWLEPVRLKVVVIRAVFNFLQRLEASYTPAGVLQKSNLKRLIITISESIGISLNSTDFADFIKLESEFQSLVSGSNTNSFLLKWLLFNKKSFRFAIKVNNTYKRVIQKLYRKILLKKG